MNIEALVTSFVGGILAISILTVILAPQSNAVGVISATSDAVTGSLKAAKAWPQ